MAEKVVLKDYRVSQPMGPSGVVNFLIPPGYKWVALINNTDNIVHLLQGKTSRPEVQDSLMNVSPFTQQTFVIDDTRQDFTLWWDAGSGLDFKKAELIFSQNNLAMNGNLSNEFEGVFSIGSDSVGLAKQTQFPASLGSTGGLKTEIINSPSVFLANGTTVGITGNVAITDTTNGTAGTGITIPTGASGKIGWLSGIFQQTKAMFDSVGTKIDTATNLPTGGSGILGWISRIWYQVYVIQQTQLPGSLGSNGGVKTESLSDGTPTTAAGSLPAGGAGIIGWLSNMSTYLSLIAQRLPAALSARGGLKVSNIGNSATNISTASTTVVKSGAATLKKIVINTSASAAGTAIIYDGLTSAGTKLATINLQVASAVSLDYDLSVATGITIVTSIAADITVIYE